MPAFCCVVKCGSRKERDDVHFYRIPAVLSFKHKVTLNELSKVRRQKWLNAIKRVDFTEAKQKNATVCSRHFISGKPAELTDVDNPDWVPSVAMGYGIVSTSCFERGQKALQRSARLANYNNTRCSISVPTDIADPGPSTWEDPQAGNDENSKSVQTDITADEFSNLMISLESTKDLQRRLNQLELSRESLKNDDVKTKYYTGLNSFKKLEIVVKALESCITVHFNSSLGVFQQVLLALVKLRLNLDFKDVAYRFNVSPTTASNYFKIIIEIMYLRFRKLIIWPEREILRKTMPSCFIESFNDKISVIIDCFELYIERPSNLLKAAQCWSNYKHHHTLKYLIGITPQGTVCFISEAWGGRVSDKMITESSEFINKIVPGDVILADRGFRIQEYVQLFNAEVKMPVFTRGKKQLHPTEIEETRAIANVRIHVERVIGVIRQKYRILTDDMPISLVSSGAEDDDPIIDKIVTVCCALTNICPPIVPL